jgi:hypothetical protein
MRRLFPRQDAESMAQGLGRNEIEYKHFAL